MDSTSQPDPKDETDRAVHEVLEYLALERMVEGEFSSVEVAIRRVLVVMLELEESADALTPYRKNLLREMRESGDRTAGIGTRRPNQS
jgi:hypothetical protein